MARPRDCVNGVELIHCESKTFVPRRVMRKIQEFSTEWDEQIRLERADVEMALESNCESGCWADLSEDLIHRIMGMLCVRDQVCSSVVCKDWHSAVTRMPRPMPLGGSLPWWFNYEWEKSDGNPRLILRTELCDPSTEREYNQETHWKSKTNMAFGAAPCAQKDGWFLFAKKYKSKTHFFLYSAFSKRCIWLPTLESYFDVATFSKSPLCPDCVVFASYHSGDDTCVATCHIGDKSWNTMWVDVCFSRDPISSVVYGEDKNEFYCVFSGGILASFAVQDHSWDILSIEGHGEPERRHPHLLQHEGQLLLVVRNEFEKFFVFGFDWTDMTWAMLSNMNDFGYSARNLLGLFNKNLGSGALFFLNEYYIRDNPYCIDPPSVGN